jgi:hypothetical protein
MHFEIRTVDHSNEGNFFVLLLKKIWWKQISNQIASKEISLTCLIRSYLVVSIATGSADTPNISAAGHPMLVSPGATAPSPTPGSHGHHLPNQAYFEQNIS